MGKSKIYTKTGDGGSTSLVGGKRVPKTNIRLEAYGTIDELNSFTGLLIEEINDEYHRNTLQQIQSLLFDLGSYLATEKIDPTTGALHCSINQNATTLLETEMDQLDNLLPKLKNFILPGGSKNAALAHICRTICRRAERCIYQIHESAEIDQQVLIFVNRLSDYYFILARKLCIDDGKQEIIWQKPCL